MTLIRRLLKVRRRVVFRKPKKYIGFCEFGAGGVIFVAIKPRRYSPAQVYLHELIHQLYPKLSEKLTLRMERYLWRRMTNHQRYLLYRKLFRHSYASRKYRRQK